MCLTYLTKSEKSDYNFILYIWMKVMLITYASNEIPEVKPLQESPNLPQVRFLRNREKCTAFTKNNRKPVYELTSLISTFLRLK